jgi:YidC/Oxa1 family membrane protein insertase
MTNNPVGNPRVFLWLALALALWLNYEAWVKDYHPIETASITSPASPTTTNGSTKLSQAVPQASTTAPSTSRSSTAPPLPTAATGSPAEQSAATPGATGTVHVRTDVLDVEISLQGGTIVEADLPKYPKVKGEAEPVRLENQSSPETLYLVQSGLTGSGAHPTHLATFTSEQSDYTLQAGQKELPVTLYWKDGNGVSLQKTFVFRPGEYRVDLNQTVHNESSAPWQAAAYAQILRNDPPTSRSLINFNVESYAFHGPAMWDGTKYRKLKTTDKDDRQLAIEVKNGWIAALQHHFVTAIVPKSDAAYRFTLGSDANQYLFSAAGPLQTVAPSQTAEFPITLFIGPKLQKQLEAIGPELDRVADYGHLTILAKPLFWLLSKVHALFGNWGIAIILVTFLLKAAFYPLSETSGRSMAKMKMLSPRIKNLQETYKDDREKLGRAMMELYQREKINPVAGCLPIVIQIPVFLAFYWVLLESVEMRQAPFMGWINDLSSRDPFFILPAIMAGAMFLQYKLQPTPADPIQAKVFMIMPLAMSVMFAFFPAGLVLYWVTNTILSIAQQWNINRRIEAAKKS